MQAMNLGEILAVSHFVIASPPAPMGSTRRIGRDGESSEADRGSSLEASNWAGKRLMPREKMAMSILGAIVENLNVDRSVPPTPIGEHSELELAIDHLGDAIERAQEAKETRPSVRAS